MQAKENGISNENLHLEEPISNKRLKHHADEGDMEIDNYEKKIIIQNRKPNAISPEVKKLHRTDSDSRRVRSIEISSLSSLSYVTSLHTATNLCTKSLRRLLEEPGDIPGKVYCTLSTLLHSMTPEEFCPVLVELEANKDLCKSKTLRFLNDGTFLALITSKEHTHQSALFVMESTDKVESSIKLRLIIPIYSNMQYYLSGDGMLVLHSGRKTHTFDVASVRSLWTLTCALEKAKDHSDVNNFYPDGPSHEWLSRYQEMVIEWNDKKFEPPLATLRTPVKDTNDIAPGTPTKEVIRAGLKQLLISKQAELDALSCLDIRNALEAQFNQSLSSEKKYIDEQMMLIIGQLDAATEIFENFLYLGTEWNATDIDEIKEKGIGFILNMAIEIDNFFPDDCNYHNVPIWDDVEANLFDHLDGAVEFIKKALADNSKILVHCKMGISRSSSAVIAFAMDNYEWEFDYALNYVQSKRGIIKPNPAFMKQLKQYEEKLIKLRKTNKLTNCVKKVEKEKDNVEEITS